MWLTLLWVPSRAQFVVLVVLHGFSVRVEQSHSSACAGSGMLYVTVDSLKDLLRFQCSLNYNRHLKFLLLLV